jgi:hypothetical protein
MKKKPLTNKQGEVRELTLQDIKAMRPAKEVLPAELLAVLPKRQSGQRKQQEKVVKVKG